VPEKRIIILSLRAIETQTQLNYKINFCKRKENFGWQKYFSGFGGPGTGINKDIIITNYFIN
jgi:hypothetical protein